MVRSLCVCLVNLRFVFAILNDCMSGCAYLRPFEKIKIGVDTNIDSVKDEQIPNDCPMQERWNETSNVTSDGTRS